VPSTGFLVRHAGFFVLSPCGNGAFDRVIPLSSFRFPDHIAVGRGPCAD